MNALTVQNPHQKSWNGNGELSKLLYLSNETFLEKSTSQKAGVHCLDLVGVQISRFSIVVRLQLL